MRKIIALVVATIVLTGCNQAPAVQAATHSTTTTTTTHAAPTVTTSATTPSARATPTTAPTTSAPTTPSTTAIATTGDAESTYVTSFNDNAGDQGPHATTAADKATIIQYGRDFCLALKSNNSMDTATQALAQDGVTGALARVVALAATDNGSLCPV